MLYDSWEGEVFQVYISKGADERKQEILDAAAKLFLTKGYKHTSVEDIAKEIGVVKGTCYHYFSTKEELYSSMLVQEGEKYISSLNTILYDTNTLAKERIQKLLVSAARRFFASYQNKDILEQNVPNHETFDQVRLHCFRELAKGMEQCIQDGNREGFLNISNPQMCALAICYCIFGITSAPAPINEMTEGMYKYIAALLQVAPSELDNREGGLK